ncbi:MAG: hypothetical protein RLZZ584_4640 [Pseudomonadota bacterium]|jgi:hypothetical protein
MPHIVLLGDSIFDNRVYVNGRPDVRQHLAALLPAGWQATLLASDGATTAGISRQLQALPQDADCLVLSVGGNDALLNEYQLHGRVGTVAEGLLVMDTLLLGFERDYRGVIADCLATGLPLVVCAVYNANIAEPSQAAVFRRAIALFDDVILRVAAEHGLASIDLRRVCDQPAHYANDIEPSDAGGLAIASAVLQAVQRLLGRAPQQAVG